MNPSSVINFAINQNAPTARPPLQPPDKEINKTSKKHRVPVYPILGPNDRIGDGDSRVIYDAVPASEDFFASLKNEVYWQKMTHAHGEVPRLVCVQGFINSEDGSMPVYRHPADQCLPLLHFSPEVRRIRDRVEAIVGHPMNHVLIQLYRGGQDNISEHSDKTLDIVRGSSIVNVSLGAQRTMRLRTKKSASHEAGGVEVKRQTQLVPLPNASVFVLGPNTNMAWLHGINADKRPAIERSEGELAFHGERISLTFRHIGTFLDHTNRLIWGQGACGRDRASAQLVVNGNSEATQKMINAFGFENQQTSFDWHAVYGDGFNVLHFNKHPGEESSLLFMSGNLVDNTRVKIYLQETRKTFHIAGVFPIDAGHDYEPTLCFRDGEHHNKTQVYGATPILMYLDLDSTPWRIQNPDPVTKEAQRLVWQLGQIPDDDAQRILDAAQTFLAGGREYAAGAAFSIADCYLWPVLDKVLGSGLGISTNDEKSLDDYTLVRTYHMKMKTRESVRKAAGLNDDRNGRYADE